MRKYLLLILGLCGPVWANAELDSEPEPNDPYGWTVDKIKKYADRDSPGNGGFLTPLYRRILEW